MTNRFKLRSGRVLLLAEPFTPEDEAAANSEEGMVVLEGIAELFERDSVSNPNEDPIGRCLMKIEGLELKTLKAWL